MRNIVGTSILSLILVTTAHWAYSQETQPLHWGAPDPLIASEIVGAVDGADPWSRNFGATFAARGGGAPEGIVPLERDIFSTTDFYQDEALWSDPRYFRCNSPWALEAMWGAYADGFIENGDALTGAWGFCDRDYPVEEIISPYGFESAREHYAALLADAESRGGPTQPRYEDIAEWNGYYNRRRGFDFGLPSPLSTWYHGATLQVPTYLSLLTPEYQARFVQQMYHYSGNNAAQWPGSYCWPEGFMRRFAQTGGENPQVLVTPNLVQILDRAGNSMLMTQIYVDREFNEEGAVPRLGADVPRWFGETIGFWDGGALISWTSNVQGWMQHGAAEFSNQMQSIEIHTPITDTDGVMIGMHREAILYDDEAFVQPVRIVHRFQKVDDFTFGEPYNYLHCVPTIYPVEGLPTLMSSGTTFEYTVPDMFGRPWAQNWERYHEEGMVRPESNALFGF